MSDEFVEIRQDVSEIIPGASGITFISNKLAKAPEIISEVVYDSRNSLSTLIFRAKFDYADHPDVDWALKNWNNNFPYKPLREPDCKVSLKLVPAGQTLKEFSSDEERIVTSDGFDYELFDKWLKPRKLRNATLVELLAFATTNPKAQMYYTILALGSRYVYPRRTPTDYPMTIVPYICGEKDSRSLCTTWDANIWGRFCMIKDPNTQLLLTCI